MPANFIMSIASSGDIKLRPQDTESTKDEDPKDRILIFKVKGRLARLKWLNESSGNIIIDFNQFKSEVLDNYEFDWEYYLVNDIFS